jgi:hypothetical protein
MLGSKVTWNDYNLILILKQKLVKIPKTQKSQKTKNSKKPQTFPPKKISSSNEHSTGNNRIYSTPANTGNFLSAPKI